MERKKIERKEKEGKKNKLNWSEGDLRHSLNSAKTPAGSYLGEYYQTL